MTMQRIPMTQQAKCDMRYRPIQILHSFEGLAEGMDGIEVNPSLRRPGSYDVNNFEKRVSDELTNLVAHGVGGIAVNVCHQNGYLDNDEGWNRFLAGLEIAIRMGLRIWLYDEAGYPSGSAGGILTQEHPELEATGLYRIVHKQVGATFSVPLPNPKARVFSIFGLSGCGERTRLSVPRCDEYVITVASDTFDSLEIYLTAPLFKGTHAGSPYTSRKPYMNVIDPRAVNRFLFLTHLRYYQRIPEHLWRHVEVFFSDEPSLMSHVTLPQQGQVYYPSVPWSGEVSSLFYNRNGYFIDDCIWSLFEGSAPEDRKRRRDFWGVVTELYEQSLGVQSSNVCATMDVKLSGHLLAEETLWQHAVLHGSAIRILQHFQIPGLDCLSCDPNYVHNHYFMTLKTALSASVLSGKHSVMVEVSEYFEYWTAEMKRKLRETRTYWDGPRKGNSLQHIRYTLALLFLAGVREYAFYFPWRHFSESEYTEMCDFVARLNAQGMGAGYKPSCALFYPVETIWEEYIPTDKNVVLNWDLDCGQAFEAQSDRCRNVNQAMTDACKNLFFSNIQYILAGREHLSNLPELGIQTLLYPPGENPDQAILALCERASIEIIILSDAKSQGLSESRRKTLSHPLIRPGPGVIYACYDQFTFVLNTASEPSIVVVAGCVDAMFPNRTGERTKISGDTRLGPYECAFIYVEVS